MNEPSTVKVNGKSAKVLSTDGGAPFKFEALVDLDAGVNTVVVEAKDGQNNTSTKTYSVATTGTSEKYEYDATGNLRFVKQPSGTVIREYRWDQQNRLVKELHGTHESAYEYDGASRRWRITEKENGTQTKQETFVWCGARICQKRSGGAVTRSYFGNGFQESGPTNYFYTRDHLGSVREVVASDGTTVTSRLSYDPWGTVTETGSGAKSDFTYTGHYYDRPTGLTLAQYRAYDAGVGRWISRDPIGLAGGLNIYQYVNNRPIQSVDPTGQIPMDGAATDRAIGAQQNWTDSSFQTGLVQGGIAGGILDAAAILGLQLASSEGGIAVWGALQRLGPVGRAVAALLGAGGTSARQQTGSQGCSAPLSSYDKALQAANGSLRAAPSAINNAGLSQADGIRLVQQIAAASNRAAFQVSQADGSVIMVGNMGGDNSAVIQIAANGLASFASATVTFIGPIIQVTNITSK